MNRLAPAAPRPVLAVEGLTKTFRPNRRPPVPAVDRVTFAVEPGETLAILGPSGCGKTTLLRLLAGLEVPDAGSIRLAESDLTGVPPAKREIAMVFQQPALYPHLTAAENITVGLRIRKIPRLEMDRRLREVSRSLGLGECLGRLPGALSGGELQRVGLARALVRDPRVLLLDEPLSQLDAPLRIELRSEITRLLERLRVPTIYVTHDQAEAMSLGSRVGVMNRGCIEQIAPPRTLYDQPANLFVAGFVGSPPMNLLPGVLTGSSSRRLKLACSPASGLDVELPMPRGLESLPAATGDQEVVAGIRPEDFELNEPAPMPPVGGLPLDRVEAAGADSYLWLGWGSRKVVVRAPREFAGRSGQTINFTIKRLHLFDKATGRRLV